MRRFATVLLFLLGSYSAQAQMMHKPDPGLTNSNSQQAASRAPTADDQRFNGLVPPVPTVPAAPPAGRSVLPNDPQANENVKAASGFVRSENTDVRIDGAVQPKFEPLEAPSIGSDPGTWISAIVLVILLVLAWLALRKTKPTSR